MSIPPPGAPPDPPDPLDPLDHIGLHGIRGWGYHGVLGHERERGQEFIVDVDLQIDTRAAAAGDDLQATVDYGRVAADVLAVVTGEPCALIETLAARVADRCLARPRVEAVTVTVHKPGAPVPVALDDVTVAITRQTPMTKIRRSA